MVAIVQQVRASDCGSECRRFESDQPPLNKQNVPFYYRKERFFISLPPHHPLPHWSSKTYNKGDLAKVIQYIFHKQELVANGRLLLRFHDTLPLSASCMPATLRASNSKHTRLPCRYPCARMQHNRFCLVFSKNINIKSAYSVHQWPTLPQKIDSREGWF